MFGFLKRNKKENKKIDIVVNDRPIGLNLSKGDSLKLLDLRKEKLEVVCNDFNLNGVKSKVAFALDFSGSMGSMFRDGTVQALIERLIPIAMKFDNNEELDLWIFSSDYNRLESITKDNYHGIAERIMKAYTMGGTNYAPVMNDIINKYTKEEKSDIPTYVIMVTDGDNWDKKDTTNIIKKTCMENVFWQFVGIGNADMDYLESLDDMTNRKRDSVDFFKVDKINNISDDSLYKMLLNEYPEWLKNQ